MELRSQRKDTNNGSAGDFPCNKPSNIPGGNRRGNIPQLPQPLDIPSYIPLVEGTDGLHDEINNLTMSNEYSTAISGPGHNPTNGMDPSLVPRSPVQWVLNQDDISNRVQVSIIGPTNQVSSDGIVQGPLDLIRSIDAQVPSGQTFSVPPNTPTVHNLGPPLTSSMDTGGVQPRSSNNPWGEIPAPEVSSHNLFEDLRTSSRVNTSRGNYTSEQIQGLTFGSTTPLSSRIPTPMDSQSLHWDSMGIGANVQGSSHGLNTSNHSSRDSCPTLHLIHTNVNRLQENAHDFSAISSNSRESLNDELNRLRGQLNDYMLNHPNDVSKDDIREIRAKINFLKRIVSPEDSSLRSGPDNLNQDTVTNNDLYNFLRSEISSLKNAFMAESATMISKAKAEILNSTSSMINAEILTLSFRNTNEIKELIESQVEPLRKEIVDLRKDIQEEVSLASSRDTYLHTEISNNKSELKLDISKISIENQTLRSSHIGLFKHTKEITSRFNSLLTVISNSYDENPITSSILLPPTHLTTVSNSYNYGVVSQDDNPTPSQSLGSVASSVHSTFNSGAILQNEQLVCSLASSSLSLPACSSYSSGATLQTEGIPTHLYSNPMMPSIGSLIQSSDSFNQPRMSVMTNIASSQSQIGSSLIDLQTIWPVSQPPCTVTSVTSSITTSSHRGSHRIGFTSSADLASPTHPQGSRSTNPFIPSPGLGFTDTIHADHQDSVSIISSVDEDAATSATCDLKLERIKRKVHTCGNLILDVIATDLLSVKDKATTVELSTYNLKELEGLKRELLDYERKLDKIPSADPLLFDYIDLITAKARSWEHSLADLKKKFFLHLSEKSLLKSVDLLKFDGSFEKDTIYEFLSTFFKLSACACSPSDQATLLYSSYLADNIKREVEPFKGSITLMKQHLISRYGDLRDVCENKSRKIGELSHPGSNSAAQISYFKRIHQLLLHCESLLDSDMVNSEEIRIIIYNASYVKNLVSYLPQDSIKRFAEELNKEPRSPPPSGQRYFQILKELIDNTWNKLDCESSILAIRQQVQTKRLSNDQALKSKVNPRNSPQSSSAVHITTTHSFPCPFHDGSPAHELGQCPDFFSSSNKERRDALMQKRVCFTCMKAACLATSPKQCVSNLPNKLICRDCKPNYPRRVPNVLVCTNASHGRPNLKTLEEELRSYVKVLDSKLLLTLKPLFNIATTINTANSGIDPSQGPASLSSAIDHKHKPPIFDTIKGESVLPTVPVISDISEDSAYIFQQIKINGKPALCFFDTGASGHLIRGKFAEENNFKVVSPDCQLIGCLSNKQLWTDYGTYTAAIGAEDNECYHEMVFQGITNITSPIPKYDWTSINKEVRESGLLPKNVLLPPHVGGSTTDILIGIKSPQLVPKLIFTLESGIGVYECPFTDIHGSHYAFAGSHKSITRSNKTAGLFSVNHLTIFASSISDLTKPMEIGNYPSDSKSAPLFIPMSKSQSTQLDSTPVSIDDILASDHNEFLPPPMDPHTCAYAHSGHACTRVFKAKVPLEKIKSLMDSDNDPLVSYRCPSCEDCIACKLSPTLQSSSLRQRAEQRLVRDSVHIDYEQKKTFASLPFTQDPIAFFKKHYNGKDSNIGQAKSVYLTQCKKPETTKEGIRKAISELVSAGYLLSLKEASPAAQKIIADAIFLHFHPWRTQNKPESKSTSVRIVCDPSSSMLNLILAKGDGGLSSLLEIIMNGRAAPVCWTGDVKKLYNNLTLNEDSYPYSLILFHPSLSTDTPPDIYLMTSIWYGETSAGAQSSFALKQLGIDHQESHKLGSEVLSKRFYVDDTMAPAESIAEAKEQISETVDILANGGMRLKYTIISGSKPPPEATDDDSVTILGYRWFPERDLIGLNCQELNFQRKARGLRPENPFEVNDPDSISDLIKTLPYLTRKHVVSKSAEVFDPSGIFEPFKAYLKRRLSVLNNLDWKEVMPAKEQMVWETDLRLWPQINSTLVPRSLVPGNAKRPYQTRLICCSDSSADCGGAAVYLCYKLESGSWSSRLMVAKSRLQKFSVPRNEMDSLLLACELTYAVVVSTDIKFTDILICTDSIVSICWALNENAKHKVFVHNRSLTINRYIRWISDRSGSSSKVEILHIPGNVNPADILTKGRPIPSDLGSESNWQIGFPWMHGEISDMPVTRYSDISLGRDDQKHFADEIMNYDISEFPSLFKSLVSEFRQLVIMEPCHSP